jgi:GxxExxY protein
MKDEFTYAVIGKAMQVHQELGPGLDEIFYHELLSARLREAGLAHESRASGRMIHRGLLADTFEADLICPDRLITELKCLRGNFEPEHYLQIICYLKFWGIETGLLFDFGKESLMYRRVNCPFAPPAEFSATQLFQSTRELGSDHDLALALCESVARLARQYGLGYRDTTYRGLLVADLSAEGIENTSQPVACVRFQNSVLGQNRCNCVTVGNRLCVLVLALRRGISAADRATVQTYMRLLELPWGIILNFGKENLEHQWVCSRRLKNTEIPKDSGRTKMI